MKSTEQNIQNRVVKKSSRFSFRATETQEPLREFMKTKTVHPHGANQKLKHD